MNKEVAVLNSKKLLWIVLLLSSLLVACDIDPVEPVETLTPVETPTSEGGGEVPTPDSGDPTDISTVIPVDNTDCTRFGMPAIDPIVIEDIDFARGMLTNWVTVTGDPAEIDRLISIVNESLDAGLEDLDQTITFPPIENKEAAQTYRLLVDGEIDPVLLRLNEALGTLNQPGFASADPENSNRILLTVTPQQFEELSSLIQSLEGVRTVLPFAPTAIIRQYQLTSGVDSADFAARFNEIALRDALEAADSAELAAIPVAEPTYIGGDNGGSYIGGDFAGSNVVASTYDAFIDQPAFEQIGHTVGKWDGKQDGATVFLFDSSPLSTGQYEIKFGQDHTPFMLCNYALMDEDVPVELYEPNSHGFFAANLVHSVAPKSQIHLVQLLEYKKVAPELVKFEEERDQLVTDLYTLEKTLNHYLSQLADGEPAVVNLSLGLRREQMPNSLHELIVKYEARGIVFVAASGNQKEAFTQAPASHDLVLGVSASYQAPGAGATLACYSNPGEIAAPGGNDIVDECEPRIADSCPEPDDPATAAPCLHGILSLSMHAPNDPMFAYWLGTSFSTPLVSGAAALALENGVTSPQQVRQLILGSSTPGISSFGAGVLNVQQVLNAVSP